MVVLRKQPSSRTPSMSRQEAEDVLMKDEEHETPEEYAREEWSKFVRVVQEARERAVSVLSNAKLTKQIRTELEEGWNQVKEAVEDLERRVLCDSMVPEGLMREIIATLAQRVIESEQEWREYVRTVEKDGELINELCKHLDTDVFQLKRTVDRDAARPPMWMSRHCCRVGEALFDWSEICAQLADTWKESTIDGSCSRGSRYGKLHFLNYLRAMTCADPGVFKGSKYENFSEFLRKFRRKYEAVISSEETLVEILADDHLAGGLKMFSCLFRAQ
ncbi:hypothetical protein COOONC_00275 [Cooperia oncophora]